MSANFRLPTLRLGTDFDEEIVPVSLPASLDRGSDPALALLDGADRAPFRLSRMVRPVALLGVKAAVEETAVRVRVRLLVDDLSTIMWDRERRRPTREEPQYDADGAVVYPDLTQRHRVIRVGAQGRLRALAVLSHRPEHGDFTATRVEFELSASEIGPSGLVMLDFDEPDVCPSWAEEHRLVGGLTGVTVGRILLRHADRPVSGIASTGVPSRVDQAEAPARRGTEHDMVGDWPGFFVVNPNSADSAMEVILRPAVTGGKDRQHRLEGRKAQLRHPVGAVRQRLDQRRVRSTWQDRAPVGPARVEVVDAAGKPVLDQQVSPVDDRYRFTLPAGVGPVYVRLVQETATSPEWFVRLKSLD